jgi:hypothetical protein
MVSGMPQPHRPSQLRRRVFESRYAIDQGLLTPAQLRSQAWRRLFAGIYADASLPPTHRLRCLAASSYLVPATAAIAGRSAATLLGSGLAQPADPVEVLVPTPLRAGPVRGLLIHTSALDETDVTTVGSLRVTDRPRTSWDLAQWLDPVEAVVLVDRMLATGRVTRDELLAYAERYRGRRGGQRFRRVVGLARAPSHRPRAGCGYASLSPAFPRRRCSTPCGATVCSSAGSIWPGRSCGSPLSTRGLTTPDRANSWRTTGPGSTH